MAEPTYNVTLHHLAPDASAAGLGYPDEQLTDVTLEQLRGLLQALQETAASLTIYEPSTPEIRIKAEREVFVVRTRYRQLCFVGRESLLRGEPHTIPFILGTIAGVAPDPLPSADRAPDYERLPATTTTTAGPETGVRRPWIKIAVLLALIVGCLGTGTWLLIKPPRTFAPKATALAGGDSTALLARLAGEYRTGTAEGDRRLLLTADGTIRLAKYGTAQAVVEEVARSVRGATHNGQPALMTADPYVILIREPDSLVLFGQVYKRAEP